MGTEKLTVFCVTWELRRLIMDRENLVALNVRVPATLKELMKKYVALDAHKDLLELTRDALREKIKRDAPRLYSELFTGKIAVQEGPKQG
jgi:hypothetical protein